MQGTGTKPVTVLGAEWIRELEGEVRSTRECLKEVPMDKANWKPHEKSMEMGYMAQLIADIPRWIQYIIEESAIDFETYEQFKGTTAEELVAHFDKSVEGAKRALASINDDGLKEMFYLRRGETELLKSPKDESISQAINHLVHHRGQLTVYLRMNDLKIPSIYGPSADSGGF
jgi:uncharacterized damage-inducible protein DinB